MGTKGVPPSGIDPPPGVAMATAIVSVMAGIPVRRDLAMTGEITLRGACDRSAILLPDAVRLAKRRSLVLHPDGKEQGIFSSE